MDVKKGRLSGSCYLGNVLKTNVCQIVENIKNAKKTITHHFVKSVAKF